MKIAFEVDNTKASFDRNWFTGEASLTVGDQRTQLRSFWTALLDVGFQTTRYWQSNMSGHSIVVEKTRPLLLAGFRRQSYRVLVDGVVVAEAYGY